MQCHRRNNTLLRKPRAINPFEHADEGWGIHESRREFLAGLASLARNLPSVSVQT